MYINIYYSSKRLGSLKSANFESEKKSAGRDSCLNLLGRSLILYIVAFVKGSLRFFAEGKEGGRQEYAICH